MVEFMRFGVRGEREGAAVGRTAFPLDPLVTIRDMAELTVPWDVRESVDRGEGRSCRDLNALLGVCLLDVVGRTVSGGTTVTDEESKGYVLLATKGT